MIYKERGTPIDTNKRLRGCNPITKMSNTTCAHASMFECEQVASEIREFFSLQL